MMNLLQMQKRVSGRSPTLTGATFRSITVAGQNYATEYYTDKDLLIAKAFANGQALRYNYNEDGNLTAQYHDSDETPFVTYTYDSEGTLQSKTNTDTGLRTVYTGDLTEVYQVASDGTETLYYSYSNEETTDSGKTTRIYSANTLGTEVSRKVTDNTASYTAGSHAFTVQSAEDSANRTATETLTAGDKTLGTTSRTYDEQGRVTAETITYGENQLYLSYQYDDQGRLTYYRQGRAADKDNHAQISRYQYDSKGQLVRENIFFDNKSAGFTRTYTYDKRGNITSAKTYAYTEGELTDQTPTKSYTCTYKSGDDVWEDELVNATAIDENSSLLYDANGNPVKYLELDVQWKSGRQLSKIAGLDDDGNEEAYAAFTYDENGIRTSERSIEDSLTFDFTAEDGAITGRQSADGKNYRFIYDESSKPTAFLMNGALYHYITNQMGDVVGVTDAEGNLALEYFYDAWGDNFTRAIDQCDFDGEEGGLGAYKLSNANPLTYRGYYFDHAIGMYYLQSRYMNPVVNRFFNADDPDIAKQSKDVLVGMNLFAYCNNDPVNNVDITGHISARQLSPKYLLYRAAHAYLMAKNRRYELSAAMFYHFLYGKGKQISSYVENRIINALRTSSKFKQTVKSKLKRKSSIKSNKKFTMEFSSGDCYYSMQKISFTLSGKKKHGRWELNVTVWDTYDFTQIRTFGKRIDISVGNLANDLGYVLQKLKIGKAYDWKVKFYYAFS